VKVLHAFSNWKWTGPADPAVRLAAELQAHATVEFASGAPRERDLVSKVALAARNAGLPLVENLRLRKHFDPWNSGRDYRKLKERIDASEYDVVHAHLLNDHLLLGAAARRSQRRPLIVRTVYGGPDLAAPLRTKLAFSKLVDGVICATEEGASEVRRKTSVPADRLAVIEGAVDLARFDPERLAPLRAAARGELGCTGDEVVFGIVARVQRHRRYDLLFEAFAAACARAPNLRLVVVGRGTYFDEVALKPVQRLGIADKVRFPGYREGAGYEALLSAFDVGLFLVPGSDGSCRAARELAAAGLPLLVTPRAPLLEIVGNGEFGDVAREEVEPFADAIVRLGTDHAHRRGLAATSLASARRRFSVSAHAAAVFAFYRRLLGMGSWSKRDS
jgi:glycosyltransferase involved in cell wall biosynthesis